QRRIALVERDRQQRSKKRYYGFNPRAVRSQHRFQLVEALLGRIVGLEPSGPLQLGDERTKRTIDVIGRALIPQARVRLASDALDESRRKAGLADPRLARDLQARRWRSSRKLISPSRPMRSVRPAARTASKRLSEADTPSTAHAATGSAIPLTSCLPRSRRRNRSPSSRRVEAATTIVPGSAKAPTRPPTSA